MSRNSAGIPNRDLGLQMIVWGSCALAFLFVVAVLFFAFWPLFGPCDQLGWVSAKDLPARCLADELRR